MKGEPAGNELAAVKNAKTILLVTYKRDGTPVATPVSIAFDGDRAFFRSYDKAWKTRRLRNDPRIELSPATLRGKPTGPPVHARAVLLQASKLASPPARWRDATGCCKECSSRWPTASWAIRPCITR